MASARVVVARTTRQSDRMAIQRRLSTSQSSHGIPGSGWRSSRYRQRYRSRCSSPGGSRGMRRMSASSRSLWSRAGSGLRTRPIHPRRADPNDPGFDAERAVAYHVQNGDVDEAAWLVFLMTHFARPVDTGWLRLRDVYGRLGQGRWDWATVSGNPAAFNAWLAANWQLRPQN